MSALVTNRPKNTSEGLRALQNTYDALVSARIVSPTCIDADWLREAALRITDLENFGAVDYVDPFEIWVDAINAAPLTPFARMVASRQATNALANRLRLYAEMENRPDIFQAPIQTPFIIVSLPRSGTTLMQKLLSKDPIARPLCAWETRFPIPTPSQRNRNPDPRLVQAKRLNRIVHLIAPGLRAQHHLDLTGPEECGLLMFNTFLISKHSIFLPAYRQWLSQVDRCRLEYAYVEYERQLQYLQSERPVPNNGHWVLKNPGHIHALDVLLQKLPSARIIMLHRDPREIIGSMCSNLSPAFDIGFKRGTLALGEFADSIYTWCRQGLERVDACSQGQYGQRIAHVSYKRFAAEPIATIQDIYAYFGLILSDDARSAMQAWLDQNPKNKYGKHRYKLDDFGLSDALVRHDLAWYYETYANLLEVT